MTYHDCYEYYINFDCGLDQVQFPGAIPANGRGGRETTLWTEQKELLDKKIVYFMSLNQSNAII